MGQDRLDDRAPADTATDAPLAEIAAGAMLSVARIPAPRVAYTGDSARLAAVFERLGARAGRARKTIETYYDTEAFHLWQRGFALHHCRTRDGHALTLRSEADGIDGAEWTAISDDRTIDLACLPAEVPRAAIGVVLPEEFRPAFRCETATAEKRLSVDGAVVQATLRTGRLVRGKRERPFARLAFTLVEGDAAVMFGQIKTWLGRGRFRLDLQSPAAHGMALVDDRPPPWIKATKPALQPEVRLGQAMTEILTVTSRHITGNIAAAANGRDPEGVHQLRVALRRLRSAFALFKGHLDDSAATLDLEARAVLKRLGPARDIDVFLAETVPPVLASDPDDRGLQRLTARAKTRLRQSYTQVRRLLDSPTFNGFVLDLLQAVEKDSAIVRDRETLLRPVAAALLQKRHRKVLKAGRQFARLSMNERHEVRLALKKLRYACDYFQTLFPRKATSAYLKRLENLQNDLGRLNDAAVAEHLVDDLAADDAVAGMGGAMVKGWYRHRLQSVEPHMIKAWKGFKHARPFWRA